MVQERKVQMAIVKDRLKLTFSLTFPTFFCHMFDTWVGVLVATTTTFFNLNESNKIRSYL